MQQSEIPEGAVTAEQYGVMCGVQRARAHQVLRGLADSGEWARAWDGRRHWYWPVVMPGGAA